MSLTTDPVDAHLASLALTTLAAAPRPAPPTVIRFLAERRRAEFRSRRLLALVAIARAAPLVLLVAAWLLRSAARSSSLLATALLAAALVPAIGGVVSLAGAGAQGRG